MSFYPSGQCTDYCYDTCGWVQRFGNLGDAMHWTASYAAKGGPTGTEPRVGAISNFQPGVDGAGSLGHVAVVTNVESLTAFDVSEQDFPTPGVTTTRRYVKAQPGVTFLYPPDSPNPEQQSENEDDDMAITAKRIDGTLDYFVVTPDGTARHYYEGGGEFDDKLPGVWSQPVMALWADVNTLKFRGIGWAGGPTNATPEGDDGSVYETVWTSSTKTWSAPGKVA